MRQAKSEPLKIYINSVTWNIYYFSAIYLF